mgnify:CR=1 FL=1
MKLTPKRDLPLILAVLLALWCIPCRCCWRRCW